MQNLLVLRGCTVNYGIFLVRRNKKLSIENESIWSNQEITKFFSKKLAWYLFFAPFFVFTFLLHFLHRILTRNVKICIKLYIFPSDGPITYRKKEKYKIKHHIRPNNTLKCYFITFTKYNGNNRVLRL